jgi:endonuclease YncB( thermonuclease family)
MPPQSRHLIGSMGWWCTGVAALASTGAGDFVRAQGVASCILEFAGNGSVASVLDGRSFRLTDGREIRLAGIEVPLMARAGKTPEPAATSAKDALETLLSQGVVALKTASREPDRYGRIPAYAFTSGGEMPVQYTLLAQGQARVAAQGESLPCRRELLAQETVARNAKKGLWADPAYALHPADPPEQITAQRGHFAVIEGKVLSVRTSGATIYMNFGRRWIEGFAVTIRKRDERAFTAAGLAPKSLEGRVVRVRGFIEQRGGPRIEAALPEQIEIAGGLQ